MKGMLRIVAFLVIGGFATPVLAADSSLILSPGIPSSTTQDMVETIKTVNAKSNCNLQDAKPITIETIGKDGKPLANVAVSLRLSNPKDDIHLLPATTDQTLNQEKNRLVLLTDKQGQAAVRFSKDAVPGKYPLSVQTTTQEFDLNAICLGLRTDYTKTIIWILVGLEMLLILSSLIRPLIFRKTKRLLVISDLHGSREAYAFVAEKLAKQRIDAVIMAGNLVDNTQDALTYAQSFIDLVKNQHNLPLFLIHGDSEPAAVVKLYVQSQSSIHLQTIKFDNYMVYGLGGVDTNVPELQLPKQGQTIFVSRIPTLPQGSRAPFVQITGHNQTAFSATRRGSSLVLDCPPASFGQAALLQLPNRSVKFLQAPTAATARIGGLAWR